MIKSISLNLVQISSPHPSKALAAWHPRLVQPLLPAFRWLEKKSDKLTPNPPFSTTGTVYPIDLLFLAKQQTNSFLKGFS